MVSSWRFSTKTSRKTARGVFELLFFVVLLWRFCGIFAAFSWCFVVCSHTSWNWSCSSFSNAKQDALETAIGAVTDAQAPLNEAMLS